MDLRGSRVISDTIAILNEPYYGQRSFTCKSYSSCLFLGPTRCLTVGNEPMLPRCGVGAHAGNHRRTPADWKARTVPVRRDGLIVRHSSQPACADFFDCVRWDVEGAL